MPYIYPKFSKHELPGLRIGGAGLGNLLFTYSRALIIAKNNGLKMIWPTWPSLKLGPWIRRENDKRFYGDLFVNKSDAVGTVNKTFRLWFGRKIPYEKVKDCLSKLGKKDIVIYDAFNMNFNGLLDYHDIIYENIVRNLAKKGKMANAFRCDDAVNVHVRFGDFQKNTSALKSGSNNTRIDIGWYVSIVNKIRKALGYDIVVNVFSDGTDEEIHNLHLMNNVCRKTFGNSIADIIALSKSPLMISSGSSFSMWARFLGQSSSISYPNQMKDRVLIDTSRAFETEMSEDDEFSEDELCILKNMYGKQA